MMLVDEFLKMIGILEERFNIAQIDDTFFPVFHKGGQPKDAEFMAVKLTSGAVGVSYVLLPEDREDDYNELRSGILSGKSPLSFALEFADPDPLKKMMGLAAVNAICQHVMKQTAFPLDTATDSLGLLDIKKGDRVGMVGFFPPLVNRIKKCGAELVVIEKDRRFQEKFPEMNITLNPLGLKACNKVLCTSTTVLNDTLDEILDNCAADARISIIGPTAGYFPDPLFSMGVDVVGGTFISDGDLFFDLLRRAERWSPATRKISFQRRDYGGLPFA